MTFGAKIWDCIEGATLIAVCGSSPSSHALMAAQRVMTAGYKSWGCMDGSKLMAMCGCCPVSNALRAAL